MNDKHKYNLDELLRVKPFAKLSEEERAYVLQLCDSAEQYEAMRTAALFSESVLGGDRPTPPRSLKANAMAAFDEKHHPADQKKVIPFYTEDKSWHQYTLVRIGIAAALIGVLFLVLPLNESNTGQLAEKKPMRTESKTKIEKQEDALPADNDSGLKDENTAEAVESQKEILEERQTEKDTHDETPDLAADVEVSAPEDNDEAEIALSELEAVTKSDGSQMDNANFESRDLAKSGSAPQRMQPASSDVMMQESVTVASRKKAGDHVSFQLSQQTGWQKHHYTAW